ncbi:hypothetical protein BJP25_03215 [Actinokineospora bangkokensis]|uniref:DUF6801 domain-containing protein n=1 Tax=Actinokineospora bangkokensis TaxID=1193682 RepID=A0A1Q9LE98_9PSEU|nr:hypothetical protein BJP25_03215 [Actinokineospora bangkokensis]
MSPRKYTRPLVAAVGAATAAGLVATGLLLGSGGAGAVPVSLTLNYDCPFPLIGNQQIKAVISTDLPTSVAVGEQTGAIVVKAVTTVPETATQGLVLVGAKTVEGTAQAAARVEASGITLPVDVPITVPKTNVPASGAFDVTAEGSAPSMVFATPGSAKISVGDLKLTLTPKTADGAETGLGTFDSACKLVAGQNAVLHTFTVTSGGDGTTTMPPVSTTPPVTTPPVTSTPPVTTTTTAPTNPPGGPLKFALTGSTTLKRLSGTVQLSGSVDGTLAGDKFTGKLALNKTKGDFKIAGALPVAADIDFETTSDISGTLSGGSATFTQSLYIKLTTVSVFGLPIYSGDTCKTQKPADIKLTGTGFSASGGKLTSVYNLTRADGCGPLNDFIGPFVFSQYNNLDITLAKG